jgi:hypothetical protein
MLPESELSSLQQIFPLTSSRKQQTKATDTNDSSDTNHSSVKEASKRGENLNVLKSTPLYMGILNVTPDR